MEVVVVVEEVVVVVVVGKGGRTVSVGKEGKEGEEKERVGREKKCGTHTHKNVPPKYKIT